MPSVAVQSQATTFMAKNAEGWTMIFSVVNEQEKTCRVGTNEPFYLDGKLTETYYGVLTTVWNPETSAYETLTIDKVTIPAEVNGYRVTEINNMAFRYFTDLQEVVLPEGIETIGTMAFSHCEKLADIKFPTTLKEIGGGAFEECDAMRTVALPEGLTAIYARAFFAADLRTALLPSTLTTLGEMAFAYNNNLSYVFTRITAPMQIPDNCFVSLNPVTHQPGDCRGVLFVPQGMIETYTNTPGWNHFAHIWDHLTYEEYDLKQGVSNVKADGTPADYYQLNGRRLTAPQQGINIIRTQDGRARKVIVK